MKSQNILLIPFTVESLTNREREVYTKRDNPSTLDKRTLPYRERSLWSQRLKMLVFVFVFCCCFFDPARNIKLLSRCYFFLLSKSADTLVSFTEIN